MKITLTKSTFYFNDPIHLTPTSKTVTVKLEELNDSVVRKLNLGVVTGVIEIVEGSEQFKTRVASITAPTKEKVKTEPKVEEVKTEDKEEVVADVTPTVEVEKLEEVETTEEPKRKAPVRKAPAPKKA